MVRISATAIHEAGHASVAVALGRRVGHLQLVPGSVEAGEAHGFASIPLGEQVEVSQVPIALAGYVSDGLAGWPPPYEEAREQRLEGLGITIAELGLTRHGYDLLAALTRTMLRDEFVIELRDALARALDAATYLDETAIYEIAEAHGFDVPQAEEEPCRS